MSLLCALVVVGLASHSLALSIGSVCNGDSDCSSTITGSYCMKYGPCSKGYCACPTGQTSDGSKCYTPTPGTAVTKKKLGESCTADADCWGYLTGARCVNSMCSCSNMNKANAADNYNCQPFGNSQQCSATSAMCGNTQYGSCSTSTCTCSSNYMWVNSGDVPQPGGCFSNQVTANMASGATGCTMASAWYTNPSSTSLKFCAAGLMCMQCPPGDSNTNTFCMSGAASLTVAMVTILLAAIFSLLL